jgi:hypothetical protein
MISPVTGQGNKGLMRAEIFSNEKLFHTLYIDPKEG